MRAPKEERADGRAEDEDEESDMDMSD